MSATQRLLDALVRHNFGLWRMVRGLEREAEARFLIHQSELDQAGLDSRQLVDETRRFWPAEAQLIQEERLKVGEYENEFVSRAIESAIPASAGISVARLAAQRLRQAIEQGRSGNRTPEGAMANLQGHEARTVRRTLREFRDAPQQFAQTLKQRLRKIRHWFSGEWGSFMHTAAADARQVTVGAGELFDSELWLSVIDRRTTVHICLPRHMKRYSLPDHQPIDHEYPYMGGPGRAHHQCRAIGSYVFKNAEDLGLGTDQQVAFDGTFPAEQSAEELLRQQPQEELDELFGPTRARLFRRGGLSVDDLVTTDAQLLTLDQLREAEEAAFRRAGLE